MRIIGIDYGDARVGVAVSDPLGIASHGVRTLKNKNRAFLLTELSQILDEYKPERVVIGMPVNMDGTKGFRAEATYEFADSFKEIYDGEIVFYDERLSTAAATQFLNATNTRGKKRKAVLDTVSACIILDGYMASQK